MQTMTKTPDNSYLRDGLRRSFISTLTNLASNDPKIILITGDVGFVLLEPFRERYPNQFLNAGIAEQNMMGVAAGMAREGWKPYVYSMSNFILLRPHEQLRNDICFANANVKLFGVKLSASYKFLGMSHNLFQGEESAILGTLPHLTIHFPSEESEVDRLIRSEYLRTGPSYMSL